MQLYLGRILISKYKLKLISYKIVNQNNNRSSVIESKKCIFLYFTTKLN